MERRHRSFTPAVTESGGRDCIRGCSRHTGGSHQRRGGIALVWTAVFLLVLIGIVGLSLDWGKTVFNVHQLHNAADAAALAGAQTVKWDQPHARSLAIALAGQNAAENLWVSVVDNPGNLPDGEVVLGRWIRQRREFIPTTDKPNAVKVVGRRLGERADAPPLQLIWGPAFNTDTVRVSRHAIGYSQGTTGAGLLTLLEYPPERTGVDAAGTVDIVVNGGEIQDNSQSLGNPRQAFRASGDFSVDCCELNVCGDVYPPEDDLYWQGVDYSVNANTEEPLPDPLVNVPDLWSSPPQGVRPAVIAPPPPHLAYPPAIAMETHPYGLYGMAVEVDPATGTPVLGPDGMYISRGFNASLAEPITVSTINTYGQLVNGIQTLTLVPGYYPGGFKLSQGGKIKLLPGVYAFGGGNKNGDNSGVVMTGGALEGLGVMLYVTASNRPGNYFWGQINLDGGELTLTEALDRDNPDVEPYPGYVGTDFKYIALFQDRANPNATKITGNVTFRQLRGTLYFPTAHMVFSGTGIEAGTQLIAGSIETYGNTSLTINYDGRFFVAGYRSILVE